MHPISDMEVGTDPAVDFNPECIVSECAPFGTDPGGSPTLPFSAAQESPYRSSCKWSIINENGGVGTVNLRLLLQLPFPFLSCLETSRLWDRQSYVMWVGHQGWPEGVEDQLQNVLVSCMEWCMGMMLEPAGVLCVVHMT